jgi:hypothetical protein
MILSRTLSAWIIRLATRRPPPARAEWARAMQCEFETMERGGLGWAFGCLTTRVGWTLRAQWLYLVMLASTPFLLGWMGSLEFEFFTSSDSLKALFHSYGALISLIEPFPLAILLGFFRPGRIGTTLVIGCVLLQHVGGSIRAASVLGVPFLSWWGPHSTIYMAPPFVGLCASLWIWYLGASLGAWLAKRSASRPAA